MAAPRVIDIHYQSPEWEGAVSKEDLERAIDGVADHLAIIVPFEVSLVLADDDFVQNLNAQYRDKNKPTDVLSFPQQEIIPGDEIAIENLNLGDIILSYGVISRDANTQGKKVLDHVVHMVVHGCLHLLGYDHQENMEEERMEALEVDILSKLGIQNPYE